MALACLLFIVGAPGSLQAQEQRFDAGFLTPSARQVDEGIGTAGAAPLEPGHVEAHLLFEYARRPFFYRPANASANASVLSAQYRMNAMASVGLLPRLELGLVVPVVHSRAGDEVPGFRETTLGGNLTGLGDVRVIPRISLFGSEGARGWRSSLALVADVGLPTGRERAFASSGISGRPLLAWQLRAPGGQQLLVNAGAALRGARTHAGVTRDTRALWSVAGTAPLGVVTNFSAVLELAGETSPQAFGQSSRQPIEGRGALRWYNGEVFVQGGVGTRIIGRAGPADVRAFASVGVTAPSRRVIPPPPVVDEEEEEPWRPEPIVEPDPVDPEPAPPVAPPWEIEDRILFAFASSDLDAEAQRTLDRIARELRTRDDVLVVNIEGHADNVGPFWTNRAISRQRAQAVRTYLIEAGVAPDRLRVAAFGQDLPVADNATEAGRAQNRRVEFHILLRTGDAPRD